MGLNVSHDCFRGAYSAFGRWRQEVAKAAGYAVWTVKYDNGSVMDTIMLDWGHVTEDNLMGKWETTPSDPLIVLFAHSDCEGAIYPPQGYQLADALEKLLPELERAGTGAGHIEGRGGFAGVARTFIAGLRDAASKGEAVEFS
jgi:hypothetical protein